MSERWKYQIKTGGGWGIFTAILIALFDLAEMSFEDAFLSKRFIFREIFFFIFGTFMMGFYFWKAKNKRLNNQ